MAYTQTRNLFRRYGAYLLTITAAVYYVYSSWQHALFENSVVDEGVYLYQGYLFARGDYTPYQDFGLWTNHMPLSFLVPGYTQLIFGTGLGAGRAAAVVISGLTLLGVWWIAYRFGGKWAGALTVTALAVNPTMIGVYSVVSSQGITVCLLVWMLFFLLGEEKPAWQIVAGSVLAGLLLMTRINLLPVAPLALVYIFWQHGIAKGLAGSITVTAVLLAGHALYWPEILKLWATWTPEAITPFLDPWRSQSGNFPVWERNFSFWSQLNIFFRGVRFYFVGIAGVITATLLRPARDQWKGEARFRMAVFLLALFVILFFTHAFAALSGSSCSLGCFVWYPAFFIHIGFVLAAVTFSSWKTSLPKWQDALTGAVILLLAAGVGYGAFELIGDDNLAEEVILGKFLAMQVPRVEFFRIQPGEIKLWMLIANKYQMPITGETYNVIYQQIFGVLRRVVPAVTGVLVGVSILLLARLIAVGRSEGRSHREWSAGPAALWITLVLGVLLSPANVLSGEDRVSAGGINVVQAYQEAGTYLAELVPPSSQVYWQAESPAVLLYLEGISIFPPQLWGGYTSRSGGERTDLLKFGLYNAEIQEEWLNQADVLLIEQRWHDEDSIQAPDGGEFTLAGRTGPLANGVEGSAIHVYTRSR